MDPLVIAGVAVVLVLVIGLLFWQWERNTRLRNQYGREYDRAVDELGRVRAQRELATRERRVRRLHVRPLTGEQRRRFSSLWDDVQAQFVDDPEGAVSRGDRLVEDVMDARGYPIADFEQRIADLSVHHGRAVDDYRELREIAHRHRRHEATTEDLRQAMVLFRNVFDEMLENREAQAEKVVVRQVEVDDVRATTTRPDVRPDIEPDLHSER